MVVIRVCPYCKEQRSREINVSSSQLYDWMAGTLIQNAMPQLSTEEREFMISGSHSECFDKAFSDE